MPVYRVTAPLVLVRDEQGRVKHCYEGAVIDVVDADHAAYLLTQGMVAVESVEVPVVVPHGGVVDVDAGSGDPAVEGSRPPHIAAKARWVEYAVSCGFDRDEAEAMTKQALIALFK